mgnify:CR=1 FL=1
MNIKRLLSDILREELRPEPCSSERAQHVGSEVQLDEIQTEK